MTFPTSKLTANGSLIMILCILLYTIQVSFGIQPIVIVFSTESYYWVKCPLINYSILKKYKFEKRRYLLHKKNDPTKKALYWYWFSIHLKCSIYVSLILKLDLRLSVFQFKCLYWTRQIYYIIKWNCLDHRVQSIYSQRRVFTLYHILQRYSVW